ncbi:MAG: serine/threonine-protein kinase [Planctomycetota bacterium]
MNQTSPDDDSLDEAFAAYLRSCDAGEVASREEFLQQFPQLADQLKELMEAADQFGQMTQNVLVPPASVNAGADTVHKADAGAAGDLSGGDPAATLPMPHRGKDDPGPTLPFDLGDYQLLEVIGRGGMGVVYRAKQRMLDRTVAVKMIRSGMLASDAEVRRFYTEAQAAARLNHSGIVAVHQFGHRAGHHFFSMEHIEGTDLQRLINRSPLDPNVAAEYVRDVASAIEHAHLNGVLHRDLKPANVLIDDGGQVRVTDFGLAKHLDADSSVTGSGAALGTPHYMAPEQAGGHSDRASHQSDVYSLGAILFACITGRPPIVADTVVQTLIEVVDRPAPLLRTLRPDAPLDLQTIVAKCLEKNPAKRYPSCKALAGELTAFLEGRPISARPRSSFMKAWHWVQRIPLVSAMLGRRILETSDSHRRFQTAILCLMMLMPFGLAALTVAWSYYRNALPSRATIAGGLDGGVYNDVSRALARELMADNPIDVEVLESGGSLDNRARLLAGKVDIAPMQASAVDGDNLCVVAPLFYEAVHVLVRSNSDVQSIGQLRGRSVAVGPQGSGSRLAAELVFQSLSLTNEVTPRRVIEWPQLLTSDSPEVAVICIGRGSPLVSNLLSNGGWRLVPMSRQQSTSIGLQHPTLRAMTIAADEYAGTDLPADGIETVGSTAFLAARLDTPNELVTATLNALYRVEMDQLQMIPRERAAEWQGLAFHPAARRFFHQ